MKLLLIEQGLKPKKERMGRGGGDDAMHSFLEAGHT